MSLPTPSGTGSRVLDDLAEVIGEAAVWELAWEFRGERVHFPKDPANEPRIAAAIGQDMAVRLCHVFGGTLCPMPWGLTTERRVRQLAAEGELTKREIARACCIAEARVYAILARRDDSRQLSLL